MIVSLPYRGRGRPSAAADEKYCGDLRRFCKALREIESTLGFKVSARGWCYILEEHGLAKGDFGSAQRLISDAGKAGFLPVDFCAEDDGRAADHLEKIDEEQPKEFAQGWIDYLGRAHEQYNPISFWDDLGVYIEVTVEKIDLKSLFSPVCEEFHIATTNISGWNDINARAAIMRRFAHWEVKGKQCVLLHCGDHDPGGLHISQFLRSNMEDLSRAVNWSPANLTIERFGLNIDFIRKHRLTWIDNLETSSGGRLDDPEHADHDKAYVQDYLKRFGARKVEANALVVRPEAGRKLCLDSILRYVPANAVERFERRLKWTRNQAKKEIARLLSGHVS
jgi:hypothetical protein